MSPEPEIALAIKAHDKELIERQFTQTPAESEPRSGLVIVVSPVDGKPVKGQLAFRFSEAFRGRSEKFSQLGACRRVDS